MLIEKMPQCLDLVQETKGLVEEAEALIIDLVMVVEEEAEEVEEDLVVVEMVDLGLDQEGI